MNDDLESPVAIASAANEMEASMILNALRAAEIKARMVGAFTAEFRAEAPGDVTVQVRREDVARAKAVLDAM